MCSKIEPALTNVPCNNSTTSEWTRSLVYLPRRPEPAKQFSGACQTGRGRWGRSSGYFGVLAVPARRCARARTVGGESSSSWQLCRRTGLRHGLYIPPGPSGLVAYPPGPTADGSAAACWPTLSSNEHSPSLSWRNPLGNTEEPHNVVLDVVLLW